MVCGCTSPCQVHAWDSGIPLIPRNFDRVAVVPEAAIQPYPGDSLLYEECWAMQVPMHVLRACCEPLTAFGKWRDPAPAPGGTNIMWAEYLAAKQAADELLAERNNLLEECIGYVERISALEGNLTEAQDEAVRLRECIVSRDAQIAAATRGSDDKNETIARLKGESAEEMTSPTSNVLYYDRMVDLLEAKLAALTSVDPTPADLPDPPRRADGTLAPQGKPFPVLKAAGDARRVGG
jgi:hypothetical protein